MKGIRKFAVLALVSMAGAAPFSKAQSSSAESARERTFGPSTRWLRQSIRPWRGKRA